MWKVLIFLAAIVVGGSAGRYELKGKKRVMLMDLLPNKDEACQELGRHTQIDQIIMLLVHSGFCVNTNIDMSKREQSNATDQEQFLDIVKEFCIVEYRQTVLECAHEVLKHLAPCASAVVQANIADMEIAVTELFKYFCDDDLAQPRRFVNDGGIACYEKNSEQLGNCTKNLHDTVAELIVVSSDFKAVELCNKYDASVSCVLDTLSTCPKPTAKEFVKDVTTLLRLKSFC